MGNRTPQSLQDAYLENAPEMVKYLVSNSHVRLNRAIGYPDNYPECPAGMTYSRAIEGLPFNGNKLGKDLAQLHPIAMDIPTGMAFTASEWYKKVMITST